MHRVRTAFLADSPRRRTGLAVVGWLLSIPVLLSWTWYSWALVFAYSASGGLARVLQDDAARILAAGQGVFTLYLIAMATQTVYFVRGTIPPRVVWGITTFSALGFAALAGWDARASAPGFELLGPWSAGHVVLAALLLAANACRHALADRQDTR